MTEPGGMGEAVTKAAMGEGVSKAKRSSSANFVGKAVVEPAAAAAGVDSAEPETGPVPIIGPVPVVGPVSVVGGRGVARQDTAIVIKAWRAGIWGGARLRS